MAHQRRSYRVSEARTDKDGFRVWVAIAEDLTRVQAINMAHDHPTRARVMRDEFMEFDNYRREEPSA